MFYAFSLPAVTCRFKEISSSSSPERASSAQTHRYPPTQLHDRHGRRHWAPNHQWNKSSSSVKLCQCAQVVLNGGTAYTRKGENSHRIPSGRQKWALCQLESKTPLPRSATRSYGRFALERMTWHSQLEESRDAKLPCYHTTHSTSLHRCHSPYDHLLVTTPPFSWSPRHNSLVITPQFPCHHTTLLFSSHHPSLATTPCSSMSLPHHLPCHHTSFLLDTFLPSPHHHHPPLVTTLTPTHPVTSPPPPCHRTTSPLWPHNPSPCHPLIVTTQTSSLWLYHPSQCHPPLVTTPPPPLWPHHPLLLWPPFPLVTIPPSLVTTPPSHLWPHHHPSFPLCPTLPLWLHHPSLVTATLPFVTCTNSIVITTSASPCNYTTLPCHLNTNILIFTTPSSLSSHQPLSPHRLTPSHHITLFIFATPSSSLHQPLSPYHLTPCHHITLLTLSPHHPPPTDHTKLRFPNREVQWRISIFRARLLQGQGSVKQSGRSKLHTRSKTLVWTFHVPLHYTDLLEIFYHTEHTQ